MYLIDPERGFQYSNAGLLRRLGLNPKRHMPAQGMGPVDVDGTIVYIKPAGTRPGRKAHRIMAICTCGAHVPAGRVHQHLKGSAHVRNS